MEKVKDIFFRGKDIPGEVGIEIEMEGDGFPTYDLDSWYSREDGSLRGDEESDSREFVLIRPCKLDDTLAKLNSLSRDLEELDSHIDASFRTGVHIHTNVRDFTFTELYTFIFLYYVFEDVLMDFAGEERVGNLFCLRVRDAEGIGEMLEMSIKDKDLRIFNTDQIRYSSLNLKSLHQYGSLEFRGLPFSGDFHQIQTWIELLHAIKRASGKIDNPREIVSLLSKHGGEAFAKQVFGDLLVHFPKVDWNSKLLSSVRLVQRLVYLSDWEDKMVSTFIIKTEALKDTDEKVAEAVNPVPAPPIGIGEIFQAQARPQVKAFKPPQF